MSVAPIYTIFMGNPGVGKSSLLNAVVGGASFTSGVTFAPRKTEELQFHEVSPQKFYCDTPGLDATEFSASEVFRQVIREGEGRYKLLFVFTLEGGRVRLSDLVNIRLVLDSLPNGKAIPYGIVVNKVSRVLQRRLEDALTRSELLASLSPGVGYVEPYVLFYPHMSDLADRDNILHAPTPLLSEFIGILPSTSIKAEHVGVKEHQTSANREEHSSTTSRYLIVALAVVAFLIGRK